VVAEVLEQDITHHLQEQVLKEVLLDLVAAVLVEILALMETLVQQILVVVVELVLVEEGLQVLVMDKEGMVVQEL
tara:strand:+ start:971 stop:1195 length:225 start_codon:yes stop_codon:yes gene_type:complete